MTYKLPKIYNLKASAYELGILGALIQGSNAADDLREIMAQISEHHELMLKKEKGP